MIESFELKSEKEQRPATFFIDCNPSLANYTELALLAANRLVIPCTADAASIRGMRNLVKLVYGISLGKTDLADDFLDFHQEATTHQFKPPQLHLFVQNRSRTLDKEATTAYTAHSEEIARLVQELKNEHSQIFTDSSDGLVKHVKDSNTLAAIINQEGCPLHDVKSKKCAIYGKETQANQEQVKTLLDNIQNVVASL